MPFCPACVRDRFSEISDDIFRLHQETRKTYDLPEAVPTDATGLACSVCVNDCRIKNGARGYCGIRHNEDGQMVGPDENWAYCDWYHDPLPTNCVADWVCPGSTNYGYTNLAVFYEGCTFNCLFCQNWHYRDKRTRCTTPDLVQAADALTGCVCFFGGDPTPFAYHTIEIARRLAEKRRKIRICWETNGSISPLIMKQWIHYSLRSNGCIKIDMKTFSDELNYALCGSSNRNTKKNIIQVAQHMTERESPPLLIVSTLLIPGYIDEFELVQMAKFLSSINREIPWSFLAFYPHFHFSDMPKTSRSQANEALRIAEEYGINHTHVGNVHLLDG
jgi:pyruvate formate lyase activating enzyme